MSGELLVSSLVLLPVAVGPVLPGATHAVGRSAGLFTGGGLG
ncbi:MAG: hypothetical protein RDU41_07035 [Clostridia bacterium]|nr:hypothetical protein [Clostridia bacterium]